MEDRWIGIYQFMETWLDLITAILTGFTLLFAWLGYRLAKNYLRQHREKVKEERKIQLIIELKKDLYLLRKLLTKFYKKPKGLWYPQDLDNDRSFQLLKDFVFEIERKLQNEDPIEIGMLKAEIETKLDLLGNSGFQVLFREFMKANDFFVIRYLDLNHQLNLPTVDDVAIKSKFFEIPIDFRSVKFEKLKTADRAFHSLQKELSIHYHSK